MSLDPKTVWKKAAARAATTTPNVVGGAAMLAVSAALWNPLPLVLWGLGSAAWVLFASTSPKYTRRVLDEDRRAADQAADREREALRAKVQSILAWQPYASWVSAGLLPDYLHVFGRLVEVRDRVAYLLAERKEDYLAGLGIQSQLTYLLTAFLQFVQARLALLQTLLDFRPGGGAHEDGGGGGGGHVTAAAAAPSRLGGSFAGAAAAGGPAPTAAGAPQRLGGPDPRGDQRGHPFRTAPAQPSPMTPITQRTASGGGGGGAGAGGRAAIGSRAAEAAAAGLPDVAALIADLDQRIAALHDLVAREPATTKTREWHIGILQKQQELLRDCASRDQQLVAQLTAVPDAFDVIAGRISAAQFDAAELAAYTGGVVEQIEETEKFVQTMRPVTDELLSGAPAAAPSRVGTA